MHTDAALYNALKYRIVLNPATGTRRHYNTLGQLHCEDGPAVEYAYGRVEWWQHGLRHRVNGPAVVFSDSRKYWFLNGVQYTEDDFQAAIEHPGVQHAQ